MEALYVCLFSNGHIKVGRSIEPNSRIASHADRVACMGVSLDESYVTECPDASEARERVLIDRCATLATERFQSEWFAGLTFAEVCKFAYDAAHGEVPAAIERKTRWSELIAELKRNGWSRAALGAECKCGQATVSRLALGQQDEPMHSVGETLLRLASKYA